MKLLKYETIFREPHLSESIAEPSSNSSSTSSGSRYSFSILEDEPEDFLLNMDFIIPFPCFFGGGTEAAGFSDGNISTTIHVVSSRIPFFPTAACLKKQYKNNQGTAKKRIHKE